MALACDARRDAACDVVLAFGGCVVGDLAGFLAATYLRGLTCGNYTPPAFGSGGQQRGVGRRPSTFRRARTWWGRSTRLLG